MHFDMLTKGAREEESGVGGVAFLEYLHKV